MLQYFEDNNIDLLQEIRDMADQNTGKSSVLVPLEHADIGLEKSSFSRSADALHSAIYGASHSKIRGRHCW